MFLVKNDLLKTRFEGSIDNMNLSIQKLHPDARLPTISTDLSAGYDLYAVSGGECPPRSRVLVKTGIAIRLPVLPIPYLKVYGSIRSRSGLSYKKSIDVGAGVIDFDYLQEVGVVLVNHSDRVFQWNKHDRIAQLVLEVHTTPDVVEVETLPPINARRMGGFGSTGV